MATDAVNTVDTFNDNPATYTSMEPESVPSQIADLRCMCGAYFFTPYQLNTHLQQCYYFSDFVNQMYHNNRYVEENNTPYNMEQSRPLLGQECQIEVIQNAKKYGLAKFDVDC